MFKATSEEINKEINDLQSDLCVWSIDNNITHSALSELISYFKKAHLS